MTARATGWRPFLLAALAVATIAALTLAAGPAAADQAGDAYRTDVAKAQEKRAAKLKKCAQKPTKAKRKACKKAANAAFKQAKQKAEAKRDKAREKAGNDEPASPREERQEYHDCLRDGGRPSECRGGSRGRP